MEGGVEKGVRRWGKREIIYLSLHCHHQNDSWWAAMRAILMLNCEGQSHKTVATDHNFWRERRTEADSNRGPSAYHPNALLLGQSGSHNPRGLFVTDIGCLRLRHCLTRVKLPLLLLALRALRSVCCFWLKENLGAVALSAESVEFVSREDGVSPRPTSGNVDFTRL